MSSRDLRRDADEVGEEGLRHSTGGVLRGQRFGNPLAGGVLGWLGAAFEAERAHWFYWVPVALGCGIAAYFAMPFEPSVAVGALTFAGVLGLRLALPATPLIRVLINVLLLMAAGFCLITLRTWWVGAPILDQRIGPVEVRGFIELIEPREGPGDRLTLLVTHIDKLARDKWPERVRIRTMASGGEFGPGEPIVVKAQLSPPAGPALPGGFDFGRHAYFVGIGGVGYTMAMPVRDADAGEPPLTLRISAAVERLRRAIGARVDQVLSGETAAIAKALVTGERGGIPESTNEAYRDSGIFHILSISGLHMAIMGGAVFWLVRFLLALFPSVALRYPVKKWAALAAAIGSLCYLAISGSSFATLRAFITISIMFMAILVDRPAIALRNVALSALIILVIFPESLLDVGFQMSFAAVVALVAAYEAIRVRFGERRRSLPRLSGMLGIFLGGIILSTVVASAAVTPFAIFHFHKTQHYAVLANLLAVPICNVVIMPAALATLVLMPVGLEVGPLIVMGAGIDAMSASARFVSGLPGAVGVLPAIPTSALALMLAGGLWLTLWRGRARLGGVALICAGIAMAPFAVRPDVLIGRDGKLVAMRNLAGQFVVVAEPHSQFELKRWLEHDGDGRSVADVLATPGLSCDSVGCVMDMRGLRVSVSQHPASLADDCAMAGLLIMSVPARKGCNGPRSVIDFLDARTKGTHAVYVEGPQQLRIETVAEQRGVRPWALPHRWSIEGRKLAARELAARETHASGPSAAQSAAQSANAAGDAQKKHEGSSASAFTPNGISRFAAPLELLDAQRPPRQETQGEFMNELDEADN